MSASEQQPNQFLRKFARNNEERHALLVGLYNTTLFMLVGVSLLGLFALYKMLYMFLAPMMWAVLVGTVLFPLKRSVSQSGKEWLTELEEAETPLILGLLLLPYRLFVSLSDRIYATTTGPHGLHALLAYVLLKVLSHEGTFVYIIGIASRIYSFGDSTIGLLGRPWVFPLIVVYAAGYVAWVLLQPREDINKKLARTLSLPIWIYMLSAISCWFGALRVIVFGGCSFALAAISAGLVGGKDDDDEEKSDTKETDEHKETLLSNDDSPSVRDEHPEQPVGAVEPSHGLTGNDLMWAVSGLVALLWVVKHDYALILVLIPLLFALLRNLGDSFGLSSSLKESCSSYSEQIRPFASKLVNITVAGPLRQFIKMAFSSDQLLLSKLRSQMDVLSSVVVMFLLALGTLSAFIFVIVQVHGETVHMARLGSSVMSSHPDWLSSALNYTEGKLDEQNIDIDDYVVQGYQQARAWLAANVRSLANPADAARADQLEEQVMLMVDNIYRMWEERNASAGEVVSRGDKGDWISQIRGAADLSEMKEELTHIVKDNIETLLGVAQSVWAVFMLNVSLLSSLLLSFTSILLAFGLEMLNFFIEVIVFLTMVYYLLASSGDRWLPLELLSKLGDLAPGGVSDSNAGFTSAIENSIFGVFGLSYKMAVFYGLYTYFVHSLFTLNIVFVPSMLAALFAAIPIMAPWTVSVVGVIELWLVRADGPSALVFTLFSFAPLAFADGKFYAEVKGMHPYMTGLSVIGGMYWLGLQGAIIGPIILCSFLVLVNVYAHFTKV